MQSYIWNWNIPAKQVDVLHFNLFTFFPVQYFWILFFLFIFFTFFFRVLRSESEQNKSCVSKSNYMSLIWVVKGNLMFFFAMYKLYVTCVHIYPEYSCSQSVFRWKSIISKLITYTKHSSNIPYISFLDVIWGMKNKREREKNTKFKKKKIWLKNHCILK